SSRGSASRSGLTFPAPTPDPGGAVRCAPGPGARSRVRYTGAVGATRSTSRRARPRQAGHTSQEGDGLEMDGGRSGGPAALSFEEIVGSASALFAVETAGAGPRGRLPLTPEMLLERPSGDLFGLTQNAGMGWDPRELGRPQYLILSTQGGIRASDGSPIALGYHTGHREVG